MSYPLLARLGALDLPPQFSYKPYVPKKRNTVTQTANAVIVQSSNSQIVHGDGVVAWQIPTCYPGEFVSLWDLYNTDVPVLYTFTGYWSEVLTVYFTSLDEPSVRSRLFSVSGSFQVMGMVEDYEGALC